MKNSNPTREPGRMLARLVVLLVMAVLIALLPGRSNGETVTRARMEPVSVVFDSVVEGCRAPVRAPTNVMVRDRGPEGRIDRIPPRSRSGRDVWAPGRYVKKAQLEKYKKLRGMQRNLRRGFPGGRHGPGRYFERWARS